MFEMYDIFDFALVALVIISAIMVLKDGKKDIQTKILIMVDLLLVIRTLTLYKLIKLNHQKEFKKQGIIKKKQRVIVIDEKDDDDDDLDYDTIKNKIPRSMASKRM